MKGRQCEGMNRQDAWNAKVKEHNYEVTSR
jgi:hypothetical protein